MDSALNETKHVQRILVGICSGDRYSDRRQGVRETWSSRKIDGIECRFFVGGTRLDEEPDVTVLDVDDSYEYLPAKVKAFFRFALANCSFDWLFKCDDETYVALDRLHSLIDEENELVGNEFIIEKGCLSGGAGYLLSRRMVELLANDSSIPDIGAEDVLIGEAAIRLGAKAAATTRLCWNDSRFPSPENDLVTSHWCSPERLRTIDAGFQESPPLRLFVKHPHWQDELVFFENGLFRRSSTSCSGRYIAESENRVVLQWFTWKPELLISEGDEHRVEPLGGKGVPPANKETNAGPAGHNPDTPFNGDNHIVQRVLELKAVFDIHDALETGTCLGETSRWLADNFRRCFTVEVNPETLCQAIRKGTRPNIAFHCANSPEVLRSLAPLISGTSFVYLDAHWNDYWPLLDELQALRLLATPPVIAIHDFKVPNEAALGYDSYRGVDLDFACVASSMDEIYGANNYRYEFNSAARAGGAMRGIAYFFPKQQQQPAE